MQMREISLQEWKATVDPLQLTTENKDDLKKVLGQLYFTNINREIRNVYTTVWSDFVTNFLDTNLKKIEYLLSTSKEDFLSADNTSTTSGTNIGYNTDYYGASGERDKDTNTTEYKNSNINNKDKLRNYTDIANNRIFYDMMNSLCESFIAGKAWDEY